MLFSDIDGTLVHYHDQLEALGTVTTSTESKTGLQYRSKVRLPSMIGIQYAMFVIFPKHCRQFVKEDSEFL